MSEYSQQAEGEKRLDEPSLLAAKTPVMEDFGGEYVVLFESHDALRVVGLNDKNSTCLAELQLDNLPRFMGHIHLKSKIYVVGGDILASHGTRYPRDVWICDLNKKKIGDKCKWVRGPSLIGAKPEPLLMAVNGKIYALAGRGCLNEIEIPDPAFEVLDTGSGCWSALPNPPFHYAYRYECFPRPCFHVVVGNQLFVEVSVPHNDYEESYNYHYDGHGYYDVDGVHCVYSFDLIDKQWYCHPDDSKYPVAVKSMIRGRWRSEDVFGGKAHILQAWTKDEPAALYLYDLRKLDLGGSIVTDEMQFHNGLEEEEEEEMVEEDYNFVLDGDLVGYRITGLEEITNKIDEIKNKMHRLEDYDWSMSSYLFPVDGKGSELCFVCVLPQSDKEHLGILLATFELEGCADLDTLNPRVVTSLPAQNLHYSICRISHNIVKFVLDQ